MTLTKKQQAQLEQLDRETLLDIVQQIIAADSKVKSWIIDGWLSVPDELFKRLHVAWNQQMQSRYYYDYYEADAYCDELTHDFLHPLARYVEKHPAGVEVLAARMLLDFERLAEENVDTSSGKWEEFTCTLFNIWLQALSAQKNRTPEDMAQAIFRVAREYSWFHMQDMMQSLRGVLGNETLRVLAGLMLETGERNEALRLLITIRDLDAALALMEGFERPDAKNIIGIAELLIDELRFQDAIVLLHNAEPHVGTWSDDFRLWGTLMVTALLEEGQKEHARDVALNAFSRSVDACFWNLYLKAGGDESNDLPLFLTLAAKADHEEAIVFLADIQNYALLSEIITGTVSSDINIRLPGDIVGSFWRSLSSTLFKHGYAQAAVVLRRRLAEHSIGRVSSQHYTYAANDAKKAIDYCAELELSTTFMNSLSWLQALHKKHYRKYSLWNIMQEKIAGLKISKETGLSWRKQG